MKFSGDKLIVVVDNFELGGVQRVLITLARALKEAGYPVAVAAFKPRGPLRNELAGIDVVAIPVVRAGFTSWMRFLSDASLRPWFRKKRIRKVLRYATGLMSLLKGAHRNVVLSGDMFGNCAVAECQRILGPEVMRSIVSIHSYVMQSEKASNDDLGVDGGVEQADVAPSGPWPRDYVRRCLQQVDAVVAVSDGLEAEVSRLMGSGFPVARIYDPVITDRLRGLAEDPPSHPWALDKEIPLILSVGRFGPQKDFLALLDAFALVRSRREARLMLVGYNTKSRAHRVYKAELEARAKRLGIADSVVMLPVMNNPYALMRAADLYVLSSPAEGFGNVLVEALHCGLPIVSTDCPGGPREILDHGKYGLLTPAGDASAMADSIIRVLDSPCDSSELRMRAEMFSLERSLAGYQDVLERLPPFVT